VPTLLIWNAGDPVIPVAHARAAEGLLAPDSKLVVFPDRGHEPHRGNAGRFADAVAEFVRRPGM
jgi:pimeloyl-ACP methyl ester carboxylesterase